MRIDRLQRNAGEIVEREGTKLAFAPVEFDSNRIPADSTILAIAIAAALIDAYESGKKAKLEF